MLEAVSESDYTQFALGLDVGGFSAYNRQIKRLAKQHMKLAAFSLTPFGYTYR
jgi:hypothetical protein